MIIRVWSEQGSLEPLRANIRVTTDVSAGVQSTFTVARTDAIKQAVDAWLQELQRAAPFRN
jgi:hypothetical protein